VGAITGNWSKWQPGFRVAHSEFDDSGRIVGNPEAIPNGVRGNEEVAILASKEPTPRAA